MPIRASEKDRYPADWPAISLAIRDRADWRCECIGECGHVHDGRCPAEAYCPHPVTGSNVVLTVAHLDHAPENCDPANLRAMYQRCHLAYDREHHAATRAAGLRAAQEAAGQLALDFDETAISGLPDRIRTRIDLNGPIPPDPFRPITTPCWLWTGWHNDMGYAYVSWQGRDQPAHRVIHELLTGESLAGHDRDHVCRVVGCVRPDHGERVGHDENQRRMGAHQTACRKEGHDWSDPNNVRIRPNGRRYCAECDRISMRARYAARTGKAA